MPFELVSIQNNFRLELYNTHKNPSKIIEHSMELEQNYRALIRTQKESQKWTCTSYDKDVSRIDQEIDKGELARVMEKLNSRNYKHSMINFIREKKLKRRTRLVKNATNSSCLNVQKNYTYENFWNELKNSLNALKKKILSNVEDSSHRNFNSNHSNGYIKTLKMKNKEKMKNK